MKDEHKTREQLTTELVALRQQIADMQDRPQRLETVNAESLEDALQRRTQEVELLFEVGQQLSQTLNTDIIYERLYEALSHIMNCDVLVLSSFDPEDKLIRCAFASIEGERQDVGLYPPVPLNPEGRGTQSVAIHTGNSFVLRDYQAWMETSKRMYYIDKGGIVLDHEKIPDDADVTRSALIVPMKLEGRVVGVIQAMSYRLDAYTDSDLRILESLASQIAVATNNALLYQQAQNEIAERVRAEENLKAYSERLAEMVEERTRKLKEAQEQLVRQERLAVLGQLAGAMAHELRNPLGGIKNAAYFLNLVLAEQEPGHGGEGSAGRSRKGNWQTANGSLTTCSNSRMPGSPSGGR